MKFLQAGAAAAALVLVTGVAAGAAQMANLKKGALIADTQMDLEKAMEFVMDEDHLALHEMVQEGRAVFTEVEGQVYWRDLPYDQQNVRIRVPGMTEWVYTRRYNLQEGGI